MSTPVSTTSKWKSHLADGFVFVWVLATSLYLSQQRIFPYIFDDEYGVLGAGAVFAGLHWTAPPGMPFYGFLLSLLTFPVYWLDLEPTSTYRAVIAGNGVFIALAALLAIKTARLFFASQPEPVRVAIVIAAFSYPAVLHFSAMAMAESALLFCFFLIAYHLTALLSASKPRMLNAIFLGLGIGLAQYAHPRGVAFVIAGGLVILYATRTGAISRKLLFTIASSALFSMLSLALLKSHLLTSFYVHEHINASLLSFVDSRLGWLNFQALARLALGSFGQLTYLVTSSFGLFVSGFSILAFVAWNYFWRSEAGPGFNSPQFSDDAAGLLASFVLLSFLAMFAAGVLSLAGGERADHMFYGRYNEVMAPAILMASLMFLTHVSKKTALLWFLAGVFAAIISLLLMNLYPAEVFERFTIWLNVTGWFVYKSGSWKIDPEIILFGLVMAFIVLTASFALSRKFFVLVLISFFASSAFSIFEQRHVGAEKSWAEFNDLSIKLKRDLTGMKLQALGAGWAAKTKGEALQFAFPKAIVGYDDDLSSADAILDYGDTFCTEDNTIAHVGKASFCVKSERLESLRLFKSEQPDSLAENPGGTKVLNIAFSSEMAKKGLKVGKIARVCSIISNAYFTRWFQYCGPSVSVTVTRDGLAGNERRVLGFYISRLSGEWLAEWRKTVDDAQLAPDGTIEISSAIPIPLSLPRGVYWLGVTTIDDDGWDLRSIKKIQLQLQ